MSDQPSKNHLSEEKSPYLQQHATNPVDWYPWGEEAISLAERTDKPIFLSIGYATCHWCHVMERESFENQQIAEQLNATFVCIKVDREELPHIDALYMECAQHLVAGGAVGWPLNVILSPSLYPFYAFTYLPPYSNAQGMTGLSEFTTRIQRMWNGAERLQLLEHGKNLEKILKKTTSSKGDVLPPFEEVALSLNDFFHLGDSTYGGMQGAPKFPMSFQLQLMMRYSLQSGDGRGCWLAEKSLDCMEKGGIYDQIGGGFSRYSVDEQWLIPHFEKMLYDNALLADAYLEGWLVIGKERYRSVCEEILDYLLRDMRDREGGFYAAEDADNEIGEGAYYLWKPEEIEEVLGKQSAQLFGIYYGVTSQGNFHGSTILHQAIDLKSLALASQIPQRELENQFAEARKRLLKWRQKRKRPLIDQKVITEWNGFVAHSFAKAGSVFQRRDYLEIAEKTLYFIRQHLWTEEKGLLRRWIKGEGRFTATLDDYAAVIRAALTYSSAGGDGKWLSWAISLTESIQKQFKQKKGAYYQTKKGAKRLISRRCQLTDGSEPSGNALHCENLLRLHQITGNSQYLKDAEEVLMAVQPVLPHYSPGFGYHLLNLLRYYDEARDRVLIALPEGDFSRLLQKMRSRVHPHREYLIKRPKDTFLNALFPEEKPRDKQPTAYRCTLKGCQLPLVGEQAIMKELL